MVAAPVGTEASGKLEAAKLTAVDPSVTAEPIWKVINTKLPPTVVATGVGVDKLTANSPVVGLLEIDPIVQPPDDVTEPKLMADSVKTAGL